MTNPLRIVLEFDGFLGHRAKKATASGLEELDHRKRFAGHCDHEHQA